MVGILAVETECSELGACWSYNPRAAASLGITHSDVCMYVCVCICAAMRCEGEGKKLCGVKAGASSQQPKKIETAG
jgi:hypothetical protein